MSKSLTHLTIIQKKKARCRDSIQADAVLIFLFMKLNEQSDLSTESLGVLETKIQSDSCL